MIHKLIDNRITKQSEKNKFFENNKWILIFFDVINNIFVIFKIAVEFQFEIKELNKNSPFFSIRALLMNIIYSYNGDIWNILKVDFL